MGLRRCLWWQSEVGQAAEDEGEGKKGKERKEEER